VGRRGLFLLAGGSLPKTHEKGAREIKEKKRDKEREKENGAFDRRVLGDVFRRPQGGGEKKGGRKKKPSTMEQVKKRRSQTGGARRKLRGVGGEPSREIRKERVSTQFDGAGEASAKIREGKKSVEPGGGNRRHQRRRKRK